jgi:N-acetylneuraminic acid mutarotase
MPAGTINNVIYVVGGAKQTEPSILRRLDAYDVATNTWSTRQRLPGARSSMNGASVIAGKLYVTGGFKLTCTGACTTFQTKTLFVYNPRSDSWVRKPTFR